MKKTASKVLAFALSVCLTCLITPFAAFGDEGEENSAQEASKSALDTSATNNQVSYREYTAKVVNGKAALSYKDKTRTSYVSITTLKDGDTMEDGNWYIVDQDYEINCLSAKGDVHLILMDGCTLTCDTKGYGNASGLCVEKKSTLTIYGQSTGTGKLVTTAQSRNSGILTEGNVVIHGGVIDATGGKQAAGIGGIAGGSIDASVTIYNGNITATGGKHGAGIGTCESSDAILNTKIYGGTINATGGKYAAGIGAGYLSCTGDICIYGGTITAKGGENAAGIGTAYRSTCGTFLIAGGTINAIGGDSGAGIGGGYESDLDGLTISGGNITAQGGIGAAGIGGGERDEDKGGDAFDITISGGTVKATAGDEYDEGEYGTAGIGGGAGGSLYGLTITGGDITAIGGNGTGRGCGIGGCYGKNILISGGKVRAESSSHRGSAAIGCDYGYNSYSITITGGYVDAYSAYNGAAIGSGSWSPTNKNSYVKITGGIVVAETNGDGDSQSACTALGVGLRNGKYTDAGTLTIDPKLTIFNATVQPYVTIENTGADMVTAMTGIEKVLIKQEIVSLGVNCMYGERTSDQTDDEINWTEATGVTVKVSADEESKLEYQRKMAKDFFGFSEFAYDRYVQNPDAQISMGVTVYTAKITDAAVETDGTGSEFSLCAVLTATYTSDGGEYTHTESRVLTQEDFAAIKGGLYVTIKVPEGKTVTEILHTNDDGTVVYDDFTPTGTATFTYDEEANTVSVYIEHCSHLIMKMKDTVIPDTSDKTPLVAVVLMALLAGACVVIARRKIMR